MEFIIKEKQTYFFFDVVEDNLRQLYGKEGLLKALNAMSAPRSQGDNNSTSPEMELVKAPKPDIEQVWTKFQANVTLGKASVRMMSRDAHGTV